MDGGTLDSYLLQAKAWLEANPEEFLTLVWVNAGVPLERWAQAYHRTGFDMLSYFPEREQQGRMGIEDWPTVEQMLLCGKRAVTFLAGGADEER